MKVAGFLDRIDKAIAVSEHVAEACVRIHQSRDRAVEQSARAQGRELNQKPVCYRPNPVLVADSLWTENGSSSKRAEVVSE